MHYQAPHRRGCDGFIILPIRPKPELVRQPHAAGWLSSLFSGLKAAR